MKWKNRTHGFFAPLLAPMDASLIAPMASSLVNGIFWKGGRRAGGGTMLAGIGYNWW